MKDFMDFLFSCMMDKCISKLIREEASGLMVILW